MSNSFNDKIKEYLEKKKEIEQNANYEIKRLSDDYLEEAKEAGYTFSEETLAFTKVSKYIIDYQICSFGRPDTKPEYKLVHDIKVISEEKFEEYASYLTGVRRCGLTYNAQARCKQLTQLLAEDVTDFKNILKDLSTTGLQLGPALLNEQGLTTRSFNVFYPSDGKAISFFSSVDILDYRGGFCVRLNDLSATFHIYEVTNDSLQTIHEYLELECSHKIKDTETFFGIQNVIYKWGMLMSKEEFFKEFENEKRKLQADYIRKLGYLASRMDYDAWELGLKFDYQKETFVELEEEKES